MSQQVGVLYLVLESRRMNSRRNGVRAPDARHHRQTNGW
jgi:hypothetical protein